MRGTMLILRGINNLLHEAPAIEFANMNYYTPEVLHVSGETGVYSAQTRAALERMRKEPQVTALYGFSGGGYNIVHIWDRLTLLERVPIGWLIIIGSPGVDKSHFVGPKVTYFNDPNTAHMDQPDKLLKIAFEKPATL